MEAEDVIGGRSSAYLSAFFRLKERIGLCS